MMNRKYMKWSHVQHSFKCDQSFTQDIWRHIVTTLPNAIATGLSETKLDTRVLNSEVKIEGYGNVVFGRSLRWGVALVFF